MGAAAAACAVVVTLLGVRHARLAWAHGLDRAAWRLLAPYFDHARATLSVAADITGIALPAVVVAVAALGCWRSGRRDAAVFVVLAPALASMLVRVVLKPVTAHGGLDGFPSGHTTAAASTAYAVGIVLFGGALAGRAECSGVRAVAVGVGLTLWPLVVGGLMTGLRFHFVTDALGALAFSVTAVVVTAYAVDAVAARRRR